MEICFPLVSQNITGSIALIFCRKIQTKPKNVCHGLEIQCMKMGGSTAHCLNWIFFSVNHVFLKDSDSDCSLLLTGLYVQM